MLIIPSEQMFVNYFQTFVRNICLLFCEEYAILLKSEIIFAQKIYTHAHLA